MFSTMNHGLFHTPRRILEYVLARAPIIKRVYWKFAPLYYQWQRKRQMDHDVPLDPLKIVSVDPDNISRMSARADRLENRYQDIGSVRGGEWDQRTPEAVGDCGIYGLFTAEKIEQTVLYTSFYNHFENGVCWEETEFFDRTTAIIENGGTIWGVESHTQIEKKFRYVDELYDTINEDGYKTQLVLNSKRPKPKRIGYLDILTDEITVDIGRNGELLFVDGRHRLCIAKILGIDEIPIVFLVRHNQWMQQRKSLYMEHNHEQGSTHPDTVEFADGRSSSR